MRQKNAPLSRRALRIASPAALALLFLTASLSKADEWVELFDGETLDGWVQRGGEALFTVEDGVIVGTTAPRTPNSFLCTEKDYGNFILELEFKVHHELNSGVQIRSESKADYKDGAVHGYQVEIDPADRGWTGGIYDEGRRGWIDDLSDRPAARYAFRQGDWNHFRIEAAGDRIVTYLNGVRAADLRDDMTESGFIGLQVHGVGNREDPISIHFREIRLLDLGDDPDHEFVEETPYEHEHPLVAEGAEFRKLADGFRFTEGPAVGPDGKIYFTDIPNERIHVHDPESGETSVFREETGRANGLFFTPAHALIVCEGGNRRLTRIDHLGELSVLADSYDDKKLNSPNDVALDGIGGYYFTDPRYGNHDDRELEVEAVFYLDRRGNLTQVEAELERPNGLILSPDGSVLYIADHAGGAIWAYDLGEPGELLNKRKFADVGSDGMTVDKLGNIYVTWEDAIIAFSPEGEEVLRLTVPENPANCVLHGKTLYVTARTSLYAIDLKVEGVQ